VEDSFIVGKKLLLTKSGRGSEARKPWTLKSGGLEPRSLTEVYAYVCWCFLGFGFTALKTRLTGAITLTHVVQTGNSEPPRGLAVKSTSLYVARRWSPEIEVYRVGSKVQQTHVLAGSWRPDDLMTSFSDNVVYVLGWMASNLQMVLTLCCDTGKVVASWPVVKMPRRLSMDSESNSVLVACQDAVRSYSHSGLLKYVIPVKVNAGSLWHAVKIPAQDSGPHINRFDC